jgi:RHS repeat-associated protein
VTSADGRLTTLTTFDDRGNVVRVDEAFGGRTLTSRFTYGDGDRRTSRTDPLGRTWAATYDAKGNLTTLTEPTGATTRMRYGSTSFGQPVELTDAEGGVTRMTYDAAGNLERVTDPTDREVSFTYDARGRRTSMTDAAGTVQWRYDSAGRLVGSTDANGHEVTYTNDTAGRPVTLTDARGGVMAFAYDAVGNLTGLTDPEGGEWSWEYDARNRLQSESDPSGASTDYRYDGLDRLVEVADPLGGTVELGWDAVDNLVAVTNPTGGTTSHTYDGAGRLVATTDPTGRTVSYEVDAVGRVVTVTDPVGRAWQQTYDGADRLVSRRSPTGVEDRLEYDLLGRLTAAVDGLGHRTTLRYDAAGRLTSVTDAAGSTTRHEHDDAGRLTALIDALDGTVGFTYDAVGQLTQLTDPLGRVRTFTYDPAGNLVAASDPATGTSTFTFDLAGRMTSARDARGIQVGVVNDAVGRTIRMDTPDGSIQHLYDAKGRRTRLIDQTGVTAFTYDPADRVVGVAAPSGTVGYGYDAAGRRATMTGPDGAVLAYGYGDDGALATLTDPDLGTVAFEHDADGRLATIERPNGVASTYRYDDAARLVEVAHAGPAGAVATFTSQLDAVGNRTALSGPDGTASYVLDELYRLIGASEADGTQRSWSYDAAGNRLTETADGTTTAYGYDADTGRLIDVGGRTLAYDAAGNVTADGDATYTWDWAGRMVTANIDGTTSTAVYDGDGIRVGLDGAAQHWDRLGPWPLLIGAGADRIVHAAGPLAQIDGTDVAWLHGDPLGSVRTVTGPAGQSVGAASFTAFGERSTTGQPSRFGLAGEQHDPSGLVYLRARMLDPALGRLLSADPVQPNAPGTQGFHRYSYTANNPTSWTDPTGNVTLVERAVVTGISSTLAGAGIGASIGWFTCGGLSGTLDLACLARETAAGAAGGAVAAIPGVGILGGLGVAGGAGVAESLVRQGMQGGIDPLQVGADGMLSAATFGIARHTLGPYIRHLRTNHLTRQTGPVSIQPGSHLPAPRATTGGAGPVRVGQAGESAVRGAYDIGPKVTVIVDGRTRILDGLSDTAVAEVKNVSRLSYTQQLKDSLSYAQATGRRFDLYVRSDTYLTGPLRDAITGGDITLRFIP